MHSLYVTIAAVYWYSLTRSFTNISYSSTNPIPEYINNNIFMSWKQNGFNSSSKSLWFISLDVLYFIVTDAVIIFNSGLCLSFFFF